MFICRLLTRSWQRTVSRRSWKRSGKQNLYLWAQNLTIIHRQIHLWNALYKFQDSTWNTLVDKIPSLKDIVESTTQTVGHLNSFIGINIGEAPFTMLMAAIKDFSILGIILAVIIPIMAGLTQFISVKAAAAATGWTRQYDGQLHEDNDIYNAAVFRIHGIHTSRRSWSLLGNQCSCKMRTAAGNQQISWQKGHRWTDCGESEKRLPRNVRKREHPQKKSTEWQHEHQKCRR